MNDSLFSRSALKSIPLSTVVSFFCVRCVVFGGVSFLAGLLGSVLLLVSVGMSVVWKQIKQAVHVEKM